MNHKELLNLYDREQRIEVTYPGVRREAIGNIVRNVNDRDQTGFILYSRLDEATADAEINAQVEYFRSLGYPFEWKVYDHDTPSDLRQRLAARGFEIEEPEALVILDLDNAPDFYWTEDIHAVRRLTDPADVSKIIEMEEAVWKEDHSWLNDFLARDMVETPDTVSVFTVWDDNKIVSAAWVYYHPPTQFASLWGGSTLPEYRRRGYYTALLVARAREARERGYRFLTVDASPMSRPILEKHGFQFLVYSTPCNWKPSE